MSGAYRFLLTDILTQAVIADVPFESVTWSHVLNAPGSFTGTLGIEQPAAIVTELAGALPGSLGKVAQYVERDGVILYGGPLWTASADLSAGTLTVRGEGWHSYFRRRLLRATKTYTGADQTTGIAKDLLDVALAAAGSPVIDTSHIAASGVTRDRTWNGYERPWIGQLIEDLAAVKDGFDFRYESQWESDVITTRVLTSYPNTGRRTNLVFELDKDVTDESADFDASQFAQFVDSLGAGEGDARLLVSVAQASLIDAYPTLDGLITSTDVKDSTTLGAQARQRLAATSTLITLPSLKVDPGREPRIGSYVVGDIVRVRGGYGLVTVDNLFRIVQADTTVNAAGEETTLTFATLDAFMGA